MSQAIADVAPPTEKEHTVMVVWPTNAYYAPGRWLGKLHGIRGPFAGNKIFWVGNLFVLLFIPFSLVLYLGKIAPWSAVRYRLTNRRLIVERGFKGVEEKSVSLGAFDSITIDVQSGQQWYHAGDLVFRQGEALVFRLEAVGRPEAFRQTLMKSHMAYVGVQRALGVA